MKRVRAAVLAASLCIIWAVLSGCSLIWPNQPSSSPEGRDYSAEYEDKWSYRHLEDRQKENYSALYAAMRENFDRDEIVTIRDSSAGSERDYTGLKIDLPQPLANAEEAKTLYTAITWDNPQFFYVGNTYSYQGQVRDGVNSYDVFYLVFTMNAKERSRARRQLETVIDRIMAGVPEGGGEFEKELYLHDQLAERCTYDETASLSDNPAVRFPNAFTAYGALVEGKGVCEGYSRAMQLLLHEAGIESTLVSGFDDKNVPHMWNMVTVNGRNYHLDPTWNDSQDIVKHLYFNLTTEQVKKTHTIDADNIGVDTCTAEEANYYVYTGNVIDSLKKEEIEKAAARQVKEGRTVIELKFNVNTYGNGALLISNTDLFTKRVNRQLEGSGLEMWPYRWWDTDSDHDYTIVIYKA